MGEPAGDEPRQLMLVAVTSYWTVLTLLICTAIGLVELSTTGALMHGHPLSKHEPHVAGLNSTLYPVTGQPPLFVVADSVTVTSVIPGVKRTADMRAGGAATEGPEGSSAASDSALGPTQFVTTAHTS